MPKEYRKRPKMLHKKNIKKYFVLPVCLLLLNAIEEVLVYKSDFISNDYLRTAYILALFIIGIASISFIFSPLIVKMLSSAYFGGRKHAGYIGEFLILGAVIGGLYYIYYRLYVYEGGSPEYLLPPGWR